MSRPVRMRRTNVKLLADTLSGMPQQRASRKVLAAKLGWSLEKTSQEAEKAVTDPETYVERGKGDSLIYTGSEQYAGTGLYSAASSVLGSEEWCRRVMCRKDVDVQETAKSGRRGSGKWIHPDLVMTCNPLRRPNPLAPKQIHAFEVETVAAFGIDSMYQAHSQGRGADFSWVVTRRDATDKPGLEDRLPWIHREIGVGLITYDKISAPSSFKVVSFAIQQRPDRLERLAFLNNALRENEESPLLGTDDYWRSVKRRARLPAKASEVRPVKLEAVAAPVARCERCREIQ